MKIYGWGRYPKINANLFYPKNQSECINYIKTNSTPDTPVILTISHKQKNGYYEYDSKVKTNKATNDKIFGKKRR